MGSQLGVFFSYVLFDRSFHGNAMSTSYSSCLLIVMIVQNAGLLGIARVHSLQVDWLSDVYLKPLPDTTAPKVMKAIDKMIVMGSQMDGNLLKAAAEAHHKAIGSVDAKGVTSAADYEAVNAAIGRIVASVPKATVMDVYNSMAAVVDGTVPNNMFSKVNPLDAVAAAKGFYTFKDVVEASQR